MSHLENHQILAEAGLLSANASAELRARVGGLSAEEIQHLLGTCARLEQGQSAREHGFLML